jgi:hypothetical protein
VWEDVKRAGSSKWKGTVYSWSMELGEGLGGRGVREVGGGAEGVVVMGMRVVMDIKVGRGWY